MASSPAPPIQTRALAWLKVVAGILLVFLGAIGHLIPLVPGGVIIGIGVLLIADVSPSVQRWLARLETRYPRLRAMLSGLRREDGSLRLGRAALFLFIAALVAVLMLYFLNSAGFVLRR